MSDELKQLRDYAGELESLLRNMVQFTFYERWATKGLDEGAQVMYDACQALLEKSTALSKNTTERKALPSWLAEGEALLESGRDLSAWEQWWMRHGTDTLRIALAGYRAGGEYPPRGSTNVSVPMAECVPGVGNADAIEKRLVSALEFYANGEHYVFDGEPDDWDSVSGEPPNWLCPPTIPASDKDFDPSWMIEDGGIARAALEECTKLAREAVPSQFNSGGE